MLASERLRRRLSSPSLAPSLPPSPLASPHSLSRQGDRPVSLSPNSASAAASSPTNQPSGAPRQPLPPSLAQQLPPMMSPPPPAHAARFYPAYLSTPPPRPLTWSTSPAAASSAAFASADTASAGACFHITTQFTGAGMSEGGYTSNMIGKDRGMPGGYVGMRAPGWHPLWGPEWPSDCMTSAVATDVGGLRCLVETLLRSDFRTLYSPTTHSPAHPFQCCWGGPGCLFPIPSSVTSSPTTHRRFLIPCRGS